MRVCIFSPVFLPQIGGVELAVHHIAVELVAMGHDVTVVTFRGDKLKNRADQVYRLKSLPPGIGRFRGRLAFLKEYAIALRLAALRMTWKYDVLNVHMAYPGGMAASILKNFIDVPTVVTCHAQDVQVYPELNYGLRLRPGLEPRIKKGIERADVVTAVSDSVAQDVRDLCPSVSQVRVVPNGVSTKRFQSLPSDMRAVLGIEPHEKVLLTVGRNHPKKGYSDLVKAVGVLSQKRHDFRCVIVGDRTESLIPLIRELGVESLVLLPGRVPKVSDSVPDPDTVPHDDLVSLYMQSDLFVLPSYIEGLPLVIPEAMMAGLPIVTTDVPGNRDVVEHDKTGLLLRAGDVEGLAAAINRLLDDGATRKRLADRARETAVGYDWPRIASAYLSVFEAAIQGDETGKLPVRDLSSGIR